MSRPTDVYRNKICALIGATLWLLSACGGPRASTDPGGSAGGWTLLPSAPLSPRRSPHVISVDGRLLVVGGTEAPACPPTAGCEPPTVAPRSDGASYDPQTGEWTPIADAPLPVGVASSAVVGDRVYLLLAPSGSAQRDDRAGFLVYDVRSDRWQELERPPDGEDLLLAAAGRRVVAYHTTQERRIVPDLVYDPGDDSWSELPLDPLVPSFDRTIVWSDRGLFLFGLEDVPNPGVEPSIYRVGVLRDGRWERLKDSEVVGYNPTWSLAGGSIVNATIGQFDGGATNAWGRAYPAGGIFDPVAGGWTELPDTPNERGDFTGIAASGDRYVVAGQGWVFDANERDWLELPRPAGGPEAEAGAAWIDDRLVAWGGVRWDGDDGVLLNDGWVWEPGT